MIRRHQNFHSINIRAQDFIVLCLCCFVFLGSVPAIAQSNDVLNRLDRLENELQTLNRAVYKGERPPAGARYSATDNQAQADILVRLQAIEDDLRDLTGRVEQQNYNTRQLEERISTLEDSLFQTTQQRQPSPQEQAGSDALSYSSAPPKPAGNQSASLPAPGALNPDELYDMSYRVLREGDYDTAEKAFQSFLEQYPDHKLASNANYWLGETYYVRNQYEKAARTFALGYQKYPEGSKTPDSLLKLALSLKGMGSTNEACLALDQLATEFPASGARVMQRAEQERRALNCG